MESKGMRRAVFGAVGAAAMLLAGAAQAAGVPGQGTWETTLQARDLNGDGQTDTFYDTSLNITWLRDANVNGLMIWADAISWADNFSFGGYTDWRLPTSDQCNGFGCTGSEMGHLWYSELGNPAGGPMTNTGDFQSVQPNFYLSSTRRLDGGTYFGFHVGIQGYVQPNPFFALAVRNGDVVQAPPSPASPSPSPRPTH